MAMVSLPSAEEKFVNSRNSLDSAKEPPLLLTTTFSYDIVLNHDTVTNILDFWFYEGEEDAHYEVNPNELHLAHESWGAYWNAKAILAQDGNLGIFIGMDRTNQTDDMLSHFKWTGNITIKVYMQKLEEEMDSSSNFNATIDDRHPPLEHGDMDNYWLVHTNTFPARFKSFAKTNDNRQDAGSWVGMLSPVDVFMQIRSTLDGYRRYTFEQADSNDSDDGIDQNEEMGMWLNEHQDDILQLPIKIQVTMDRDFQCEQIDTDINYNSKTSTNMVGLRNQGATCYLNGVLQMLFHIRTFREAVYHIPSPLGVGEGDVATQVGKEVPVNSNISVIDSSTSALQSVFKKLQLSSHGVTTDALTDAFGWAGSDAFLQQDAQEMMGKLLERLEASSVGSAVDGFVQKTFRGKLRNFIKCTDVQVESNTDEEFYHVQLDVLGCTDIYESFRKYVRTEKLDGENKYDAGEYGKQNAEKGCIFLNLPPVLTIVLKRFEFNMERMRFVKVHDNHMFPTELNLDEFVVQENANANTHDNDYVLHSVLVHSGDVGAGHYYAYIRPSYSIEEGANEEKKVKGNWYRFNDENVCKVSETEAVNYNFGYGPLNKTHSSAYMLLYIRKSELENIMSRNGNSADVAIPDALLKKLVAEEELIHKNSILQDRILLYSTIGYVDNERVAKFDEYIWYSDFANETVSQQLNLFQGYDTIGMIVSILKESRQPMRSFRLWCCDRRFGTKQNGYFPSKVLDRNIEGSGLVYKNMYDLHRTESQLDTQETGAASIINDMSMDSDSDDDEDPSGRSFYYLDAANCYEANSGSCAKLTDHEARELNACVIQQDELHKLDEKAMNLLRFEIRRIMPGLDGEDFNAIADNNAASSGPFMNYLIDRASEGAKKQALVALKQKINDLAQSWRKHVLQFYPTNIASAKDEGQCLCMIKIFDPLHIFPEDIAKAPDTRLPNYHFDRDVVSKDINADQFPLADDEKHPYIGHRLPLKFATSMYCSSSTTLGSIINKVVKVPLEGVHATLSAKEDATYVGEPLTDAERLLLDCSVDPYMKFNVILQHVETHKNTLKDLRNEYSHQIRDVSDQSDQPLPVMPVEEVVLQHLSSLEFGNLLSSFHGALRYSAVTLILEPVRIGGDGGLSYMEKLSYLPMQLQSYDDWIRGTLAIPAVIKPFDEDTASALATILSGIEKSRSSSSDGLSLTGVSDEANGISKKRATSVNGDHSDVRIKEPVEVPEYVNAVVNLQDKAEDLRATVAEELGIHQAENLEEFQSFCRRLLVYVAWNGNTDRMKVVPLWQDNMANRDNNRKYLPNRLKHVPPMTSAETNQTIGAALLSMAQPTLRNSQFCASAKSGQVAHIYFRLAPFLLQTNAQRAGATFWGNLSDFYLRPLEVHIVDERLRSIRRDFFQHYKKIEGNEVENSKKRQKMEETIGAEQSSNEAKAQLEREKVEDSTSTAITWPPRHPPLPVINVFLKSGVKYDYSDTMESVDKLYFLFQSGAEVSELLSIIRTHLGVPNHLNVAKQLAEPLLGGVTGVWYDSTRQVMNQDWLQVNSDDGMEESELPELPLALLNIKGAEVEVLLPRVTFGLTTEAILLQHQKDTLAQQARNNNDYYSETSEEEDTGELYDKGRPLPPCWMNTLDKCSPFDCQQAYLALQLMKMEDILFMRNQAGRQEIATTFTFESNNGKAPSVGLRSVPAVVYSYLLHGAAAIPLSPAYGMHSAILTYIREDDTMQILSQRISEITGESARGAQGGRLRYAIIANQKPIPLPLLVSETETENENETEEYSEQPEEYSDTTVGAIWNVVQKHCDTPALAGDIRGSESPMVVHVGIQRSAAQLTLKRRVVRGRGVSIK